jgi:hypothetical protein
MTLTNQRIIRIGTTAAVITEVNTADLPIPRQHRKASSLGLAYAIREINGFPSLRI